MSTGKNSILLVDDSSFNIKLFKRYLADEPYQVDTLEDGQQAWECLQANPGKYSAVLLDMVMPGMDGLQVIKKMRQEKAMKQIPVIFETANEEELDKGIKAGADYYIKKPFKAEDLQTTIRAAVKKYSQVQELQSQLNKGAAGLSLVTKAEFKLQTLEQADSLAIVLADVYPQPDKVIMGIAELLINAVEHGNLGITYSEKSQLTMKGEWRGEVDRRLSLDEYKNKQAKVEINQTDKMITLRIEDEGEGFDWKKYMEFDPARAFDAHGRGIATANQICFDTVEYEGKGNIVTVTVNK